VVWHADSLSSTTGQDYASALRGDPNWQAAHYTTGAAMVLHGYYANTANQDYSCAGQFDLDEFDGGTGREYLGQPLSAPQTAPWRTYSGHPVWRQDFEHGIVLVRPPESSPVTTANTTSITVPAGDLGGTFHLFTGTQDTARYNGSSVTSWTFPRDRDAVILRAA
jgi:hypothetical protein